MICRPRHTPLKSDGFVVQHLCCLEGEKPVTESPGNTSKPQAATYEGQNCHRWFWLLVHISFTARLGEPLELILRELQSLVN